MGIRDKAERAKQAAKSATAKAYEDERLKGAVDKARAAAADLSEHQAVRDLDFGAVRDAAVDSSGLTNRKGKVSKSRVIRSAMNPLGTAASAGKGVGNEVLRQRRVSKTTSSDTTTPGDEDTA